MTSAAAAPASGHGATRAEVTVPFEGRDYTLRFDHAAIAHFEDHSDWSIFEVFETFAAAKGGGRPPKLTMLAALLRAGLHASHPEVDRDTAMQMALDPAVQAALGGGLTAAMPAAGEGSSAEGNGAAATGRSGEPAPTGTRSSRSRSKRA